MTSSHMLLRLLIIGAASGALVLVYRAYTAPLTGPIGVHIIPGFLDLGDVSPGKRTATFRIWNNTDHPVTLLRAQVGCSCTSVKYGGTAIPAGAELDGTCDLDTAGRRGSFQTSFSVNYAFKEPSGREFIQSAPCIVRANVIPFVDISPARLKFDGKRGGVSSIKISSKRPHVRALAVRADDDAVVPRLSADGLEILVEFYPERWKGGQGTAYLTIETSCADEKIVRIGVQID